MKVTENLLINVSGTLVVVGLVLLWYTSILLENKPLTHEEFLESKDVRVVLEGNITDSRINGDITFVEIQTTCNVPGVLFEQRAIEPGPVKITGTKKYYKGKPEIIIDQVKK